MLFKAFTVASYIILFEHIVDIGILRHYGVVRRSGEIGPCYSTKSF